MSLALKGVSKIKLILKLPVPVSINSLYVNQFIWDNSIRRRVPSGAKILSKAGEKSKNDIQHLAREQMKGQEWDYIWTENKNNFLYLDIVIYFGRRGRDSDNILKLLFDSLEKIVYDNDSRILPRIQMVLYDTENPRIEVVFSNVDYIGIFNDIDKANEFKDNCETCTRYLNARCSILVDSLAATVREEVGDINNPICQKYKKINK